MANYLGSVLRLLKSAADPTGAEGALYWHSGRKVPRVHNGSIWTDLNPVQAKHQAADITTTTLSSTGVDLWTYAVENGGVYTLDFYGMQRGSVVGATPRYAIGGGTSVVASVGGYLTAWTSTTASTTTMVTATNVMTGTNVATAATSFAVEGHFRITPSATGNLIIRWGVAAAGTGTLMAGSYGLLTRIA